MKPSRPNPKFGIATASVKGDVRDGGTDLNGFEWLLADEPDREWRKSYPVEQRHDDLARRKYNDVTDAVSAERIAQLLDRTCKPSGLRSPWTDRAVLELERTGARRAIPEVGVSREDNWQGTIVVP